MRKLNWDDLKYFNAVAQTLSIREAANLHRVSAATLSRRIVSLEEQLGDALFVRKANRLSLTPFGREILLQVEEVSSRVRGIENRCGVSGRKYKIRFRVPNAFARNYVLPLIRDLASRSQDTVFSIACAAGGFDPELDDVVICYKPVCHPDFTCRELQPIQLRLYRSRGAEGINSIVLYDNFSSEAEFLNSRLREAVPDAQGSVLVDNVDTYVDSVAQGLGMGFICPEVALRHGAAADLEPLPPRINRRLWLCLRKDAYPISTVRQIERHILRLNDSYTENMKFIDDLDETAVS